MNTADNPAILASVPDEPAGTNCGRNAKKNSVSLGLSRLAVMPVVMTERTDDGDASVSTCRAPVSRQVAQAIQSRYATPAYLIAANANPDACSTAARPVSAATACGTVPSVQANAASRPARVPRASPAPIV